MLSTYRDAVMLKGNKFNSVMCAVCDCWCYCCCCCCCFTLFLPFCWCVWKKKIENKPKAKWRKGQKRMTKRFAVVKHSRHSKHFYISYRHTLRAYTHTQTFSRVWHTRTWYICNTVPIWLRLFDKIFDHIHMVFMLLVFKNKFFFMRKKPICCSRYEYI